MPDRLLETAVIGVQSIVAQTASSLDAVLADHRLTGPTAQALWAVDPDDQPPSMKVMAQRLFCNAPNLTFVVSQLSDRGLVERVVDPDDRRSRLVTLTADGVRVRALIIEAAMSASPLATLDGTQLRQLVGLLEKAVSGAHEAAPTAR